MCNFNVVDTTEYQAVFVNRKVEIPLEIIPLGIYRNIPAFQELCEFVYLLEGVVKYKILDWQNREAKDGVAMQTMNTIIDNQKSFKYLVKE